MELPDNPVPSYSAANLNVGGVGVYDSTTGYQFGFRGVISATAGLTVTLDAANKNISLNLDYTTVLANLPQATTAQRGVGETSTDAEALAKASITTFLTPSNLAAIGATTTFAGLIEIATDAEALAGAATNVAIVPSSLAAVTATIKQTATWANAVARAALAPIFEGQFGYQLDTNQPYVGFAAVAGSWLPVLTTESTGGDSVGWDFTGGDGFAIQSSDASALIQFSTLNFTLDTCTFNLSNISLQIGGVAVPAASVLITSGAGTPSSALRNTFISTANTQTGWSGFSNTATLRTADCNTVTLPQLAQIVDTLVKDLQAVKLPAV